MRSLIQRVTFQWLRCASTCMGERRADRMLERVTTLCVGMSMAFGSSMAVASAAIYPQPLPYPAPIVAPRDRSFNGTVTLVVDATDIAHKLFNVRETLPVQASGPLTLLYPAWESASHAETIPVANLAGLIVSIDGKMVEWQRDAVDMHAFHIDVPVGARTVDVEFQYLTRASDAVMTPNLVDVQWQRLLLYPAGWFARNIPVAASLKLPAGLNAFTSLEMDRASGDMVAFKPASLEVLTDSPVYAGRYTRQVKLTPDGVPTVWLDMLADSPGDLAETSEDLSKLRQLLEQTRQLLGPAHYAHYDAIVTLSDAFPAGGIEHLESGEDNLPANYFTDGSQQLNNRDLIAHEYVHSWNGKFRQPADLWTPTLNVPMRDSLLWVYEGQTEFWGRVLAARSGQRTRQETLDKLALDAAVVDARVGRSWKTLQDSNNDPLYMAGHPVTWRDWQRREDYYPEGVMLWLDVDAIMRERSNGKKSLDDFAHAFFDVENGSRITSTYTFEQVCDTLDRIVPYDWRGFLRSRLDAHDSGVLDGLTRMGWRLVYTDTPTATFVQDEADSSAIDLTYSIGLSISNKGDVRAVSWEGPAFKAGMAPGAHIISVNGEPYTSDRMKEAVKSATSTPIEIRYEADGQIHSAEIPYHGTLRYPQLERIPGSVDRLSGLLAPINAH